MMTKILKNFIQKPEHKEWIKNKEWEKIYAALYELSNFEGDASSNYIKEFTSLMYDCGIDVLDQLENFLPNQMFYEADDPRFETIHIPEGVTTIGVEAFSMSESIKKVYLPKSLKLIYGYAFSYSDIEEVIYPGTKDDYYNKVERGDGVFEGAEKIHLIYKDGDEIPSEE